MSLAKIVKNFESTIKPTVYCAYYKMYEALSTEDKKALDSLFAKGMATRVIVELLAREGIKIGNEAVNSHKYNRCRCPQKESK